MEIALAAQLECGDCDCKRLKVLVTTGIAVLGALIAIRARNQQALRQARAAIEKAMDSARRTASKGDIGLAEVLEPLQNALLLLDIEDDTMFTYDENTEKLIEQWKEAEKTAFKPDEAGAGETPIRIIDTGE